MRKRHSCDTTMIYFASNRPKKPRRPSQQFSSESQPSLGHHLERLLSAVRKLLLSVSLLYHSRRFPAIRNIRQSFFREFDVQKSAPTSRRCRCAISHHKKFLYRIILWIPCSTIINAHISVRYGSCLHRIILILSCISRQRNCTVILKGTRSHFRTTVIVNFNLTALALVFRAAPCHFCCSGTRCSFRLQSSNRSPLVITQIARPAICKRL